MTKMVKMKIVEDAIGIQQAGPLYEGINARKLLDASNWDGCLQLIMGTGVTVDRIVSVGAAETLRFNLKACNT